MKHISKSILAALAIGLLSCGLFSQQAQAAPITGEIKMTGDTLLDAVLLQNAKKVNVWFDVFNNPGKSTVLPGADGSFAGIPAGTSATMGQPWTFGSGLNALWSVGGFTFDLVSSNIVTQTSKFLNVEGSGIVHGPAGFDDTAASFSFTIDNANGGPHLTFGFAADTVAAPDGGTTVMLLGAALGVLGIARRALKR